MEEDREVSEEFFCTLPPISQRRKYLYTKIYRNVDEDDAEVVGVLCLSDFWSDHFIIQFTKDDDVSEFFINEIVLPTEDHGITEGWVVNKAFNKTYDDDFHLTLPLATGAASAKSLCENLYVMLKNHDYLFPIRQEQEVLDL